MINNESFLCVCVFWEKKKKIWQIFPRTCDNIVQPLFICPEETHCQSVVTERKESRDELSKQASKERKDP